MLHNKKNVMSLGELFSRFLSLYESTINYVDILLSQYLKKTKNYHLKNMLILKTILLSFGALYQFDLPYDRDE